MVNTKRLLKEIETKKKITDVKFFKDDDKSSKSRDTNTFNSSNMNIASKNYGVLVYDLEGKKSLSEIVQNSKLKAKYNSEAKNYFNLIDDLEFPTACNNICLAADENHLWASGIYKPQVRCFTLDDLTMKFKRHVDYEILKLCPLTSDYKKMATLCVDRYIEIHAQWGSYYRFRIPKYGRDITYHDYSAELVMVGSSNEIYRFNLEQGMFRKPTLSYSNAEAINTVKINPVHQLFGLGCDNGFVECMDPRSKKIIGCIDAHDSINTMLGSASSWDSSSRAVTAFEFDSDGIGFAVGTHSGKVGLFDLRKKGAVFVKDHHTDLPIVKIAYHDTSKNIFSADTQVVKIWDKSNGNNYTNLELTAKINDFCIIPHSGMVLVGGERSKIKPFYIPSLGPAPKWCAFVDQITEELEDFKKNTVYQDFKFLTLEEVQDLGLEDLFGTDLLRPYMHGFFIKMSLYRRALEYSDQKSDQISASEILTPGQVDSMSEERLKEERVKALVDFITQEDGEQETSQQQTKKPQIAAVDDDRFKEMLDNPDFAVEVSEKKKKFEERKAKRREVFDTSSHRRDKKAEREQEDSIGIYGIESAQSLNYNDHADFLDFGTKNKNERNMSFHSRLNRKGENEEANDKDDGGNKRKRRGGSGDKRSKHVKKY
ncbi:hypothetical protein C9374_011491 [Naegleria lovaniensis]|uniref:NUC153 domain-containing protein n=1 Tax=Naegleria lovaniensis TaxID=51637 RepID=A0AA88KQU1_NAELO|nr:uncharacterized protein C9374_014676 [Naegleria lovaniensis]XP_044554660.1 uncharacterized protein C9374_011491 [Naegleria lovaniensis]KAG2370682.1 hypothetical protein C9374_014676 [Naegleria lovaniensis]KAG2392766.1 hypothetical protein C9374_011491 [Naegleria lovaniensis]